MHIRLHSVNDVSVVEITLRALDPTARLDELATELYELVDRKGHRRIVLDLSNVQFLASRALGIIVTLKQKIDYQKGQLVICGLRQELAQVFKFAKLDTIFTFRDTRKEALASFDQAGDA